MNHLDIPVVQEVVPQLDTLVVMLVKDTHKEVHPVTHLEEDIPVVVKITHKEVHPVTQ